MFPLSPAGPLSPFGPRGPWPPGFPSCPGGPYIMKYKSIPESDKYEILLRFNPSFGPKMYGIQVYLPKNKMS